MALLAALLEDGLEYAPRDSQGLHVRSWLDYAGRRVPQLLGSGAPAR